MRTLQMLGLIALIACDSDKSITVQNASPIPTIISHSEGDTVLEGIPTLFAGTVTDANHAPDMLRTFWYVNGEVVCDGIVPDAGGLTQCELTILEADSEVTLAVQDIENARGEETIRLLMTPTEPPSAVIVSPVSTGVYYSDALITFEGVVDDAEDDYTRLTAFWEDTPDGLLSNIDSEIDSTGTLIGYGYLSEGEHALELHVTDSTGKLARETVIFEVGPPNSAPLCEIVSPVMDSAGVEGETVQFTAVVSDVDVPSDWLTVEWHSDKDGVLGTSQPTSDGDVSFALADLSINTHNIVMTVADEVGATCTKAVNYTVGTPPTVQINAPVNGDVYPDNIPIEFNVSVSDSQDVASDLALEWVVNGNIISQFGATSTGESMFTYGALSHGTYNLIVTATDTDGLTDSDQVNFTINGTPSMPTISILPSSPVTSDDLTANIDVASVDPEGSPITYTYEWLLGTQVQSAYVTDTLPSSATSKGEQWTVNVTPSDGLSTGTVGSAIVTIQNSTPLVTSINITPSSTVVNDSVLTCSATATDPDEVPVIAYDWTIGGVLVGTGATLDLSSTSTMPLETVVCTATATDLDGATDSGAISVSVDNRSPTVTASLNANGTTHNGILTCVGSATDADGETPNLTFEWFNASGSLGFSNPLQLTSTMGVSNDVIDCVVTATDGFGGVATATVSHTITNTPPVISTVVLTPDPAIVGQDDLTCSVGATDVDGDPLLYTYEWSDSNGVQQTTPLVSDTTDVLIGSGTTEGVWTCEVTPFDGADFGTPQSDSTTVINDCTSLAFDGVDDYVLLGQGNNLLGIQNEYTLSLWMYRRNTTTFGLIDLEGSRSSTPANCSGITMEVMNGDTLFGSYGTGVDQGESTRMVGDTLLPLQQWIHIAMTRNGSTLSFYLNGQLDTQSTTLPSGNINYNGASYETDIYQLGAYMRNGVPRGSYFDGFLQDVRVWNIDLSSSEIAQVLQGQSVATTNLVGHWELTEGQGTTVVDSSNNQLDGVIEGAVWVEECPTEDLDGDGSPTWADCDDQDPLVSSLLTLDDCDGLDNDCDGDIDEDCPPDTNGLTVNVLPKLGGFSQNQCYTGAQVGGNESVTFLSIARTIDLQMYCRMGSNGGSISEASFYLEDSSGAVLYTSPTIACPTINDGVYHSTPVSIVLPARDTYTIHSTGSGCNGSTANSFTVVAYLEFDN